MGGGFWPHRWLTAQGVTNYVVDAASIEVPRRGRRVKTDRLDADKLVLMLVRYCAGDRRTWQVVQVPSAAAEDARHRLRTLCALRVDATRLTNRIKGVLATQGCRARIGADFDRVVPTLRGWDGAPLPPGLQERVVTEWRQWQQVAAALRHLERATDHATQTTPDEAAVQERQLRQLKGVGLHARRFTCANCLRGGGLRIGGSWRRSPGWRRRRIRAVTARRNKELARVAIGMSAASRCNWRGAGCATNRTVR